MFHAKLHGIALTLLRFSLAFVFLWFGLLKLFGVSPVLDVIARAYPFMVENKTLFLLLAILEVALGIGILVRRFAVLSAWIMVGHLLLATGGVLFSPQAFVNHFPFLSVVGEFVIKNIVLIASALLVIAYEAKE
ncbi:DUF417 family protein [Candidatus Parcubacteria bacterium]|nr:MAG: DUF417 family protein [Candidatus Parcubacteria bacterium]